jgi:chromosome segregation ATPase
VKKTFAQTSFLQTAKSAKARTSSMKAKAVALLRSTHSPKLEFLATQVELNAFTKVKKAINDLIAELKKKKEDEYKKRDYCVASFDENATATDETSFKLEDLEGLIGELTATLEQLEEKIEGTKTAIGELKVDTAVATDDRKQENAEYQQVFQDQKVTIEILAKAKQKLTDFYNAKKEKSFLAEEQPGGPAGLAEGGYKKRNSGGVVQMLDSIIADAKTTLGIAINDEQAAQAAYEKFLGAARKDMGTLQKTMVTDNETKANKEQELVDAKNDQDATLSKLEGLTKAKAALHGECDFLMKNFDDTQAAMAQEIEALIGAINILSGALE